MADLTPEALAAELDADAKLYATPGSGVYDLGLANVMRGFADKVRRDLAPAHAAMERDWNAARDLQLRYRAALEAILAKVTPTVDSLDEDIEAIAREALEGGHG